MTRLEKAQAAYVKAFDVPPHQPFGPNDDVIADVLEAAVRDGKQVPDDFDWWAYVPPGGVA